ncbi:MAG: hypothetical protein AB7G93_20245 [Bdellovibrionales bacterium]
MGKTVLSLFLVLSFSARAHEGHDYGSGSVPLQKGGVMRSLETVHLELVYKDKSIWIYPFEVKSDPKNPGKLKPAEPGKFPVSATVELPKAKPQLVELKPAGDHWIASLDPKGAHRFTVILKITQGGHDDQVKWTVEPKK